MKKFIFNQYVETLVLANLLLISYEKFFNHMKIGENYAIFINYIKFNIIAFLATVIITILDGKYIIFCKLCNIWPSPDFFNYSINYSEYRRYI